MRCDDTKHVLSQSVIFILFGKGNEFMLHSGCIFGEPVKNRSYIIEYLSVFSAP